jgi:hypothetical protein
MRKVFDHTVCGKDAAKRLLSLHQGSQSVAEMAYEFSTLASESDWDEEALQGAFRNSLTETLNDELVSREEPDLDELISLTIRIDNRLRECRMERVVKVVSSLTSASVPCYFPLTVSQPQACSEPESMQLGQNRLSPEERQQRVDTRSCLYCGQVGHLVSTCSLRPARRGSGDMGKIRLAQIACPCSPRPLFEANLFL